MREVLLLSEGGAPTEIIRPSLSFVPSFDRLMVQFTKGLWGKSVFTFVLRAPRVFVLHWWILLDGSGRRDPGGGSDEGGYLAPELPDIVVGPGDLLPDLRLQALVDPSVLELRVGGLSRGILH